MLFTYNFTFEDGRKLDYQVEISEDEFAIIGKKTNPPDWARLSHCQCENCPYKEEDVPYCPIAINLHEAVNHFKDFRSYENVQVEVSTPQRNYSKKTDLQHGLFGLFGLIMAVSECPFMQILRPMARFHLPFASDTETIIKVCSTYLLGQFVRKLQGKIYAFDLVDLKHHYDDIIQVNKGMASRFQSIKGMADANANAIIILDSFAMLLNNEIDTNLEEIKSIFS